MTKSYVRTLSMADQLQNGRTSGRIAGPGAPKPIKGVIFDKDGTLFDFQATWGAWSRGMIEAEARGDTTLMSRMAEVLSYDLTSQRFQPDSIIASPTADLADCLLPLLPTVSKDELIARLDARAALAAPIEAAPLRVLFDRLRGMSLVLGIATNDVEVSTRAHLRTAGIEDMFDFIACYDSGWGAKPDAGQLLAFVRATGLKPEDCVMIGDSLDDLGAARAAGMMSIAVLTGLADRATLAPSADLVLTSIAQLPDWLASGVTAPDVLPGVNQGCP